jgi:aminoglycoside phosphotransferase family enzyme
MSETVKVDRPAAPGLALLCEALSKAEPRPRGASARLVVINTRMSQVLLAGPFAIKLRRAWPAFASAAARRTALEGELRCNRRLSSSVYLGVLPIPAPAGAAWQQEIGSAAGSVGGQRLATDVPPCACSGVAWPLSAWPDSTLAIAEQPIAAQRIVDWALVMRRLPHARMLDQAIQTGTASTGDIDRVAARLAEFYNTTTPLRVAPARVLARIDREQRNNRRQLLALADQLSPARGAARVHLIALLDRSDAAWCSHRALVEQRIACGAMVEAHGDLRPEHVCLIDPIELIDRLEFDRSLRLLDPWEELCLLGLLCALAGGAWIGPRLAHTLERAMHQSRPARGLLAFYCAHHALVRARLALSHLHEARAPRRRHWLSLTRRYLSYAEAALDGWNSLDA